MDKPHIIINDMLNRICIIFLVALIYLQVTACRQQKLPALSVSSNGRYLQTAEGKPFFWLGDTGWLLLSRLNREAVEKYLSDRQQKGFNVIQVMLLHNMSAVSAYGDSALVNRDAGLPRTTPGNNFEDTTQYDYWDHVDYVIDKAAEKGLYMALVPVWGTNVKAGNVSEAQATAYASFLAERYRNRSNIIWLNGGDINGSDSILVWKAIGNTLHEKDPQHLVTFHPRGRTQSSDWFHTEPWLAFNMFQSGHRRYDQDTTEKAYGEDNWKYVTADYNRKPVKPVIDGEPSYEGIPQGLHDTLQPLWTDNDVRRYGYWSVFAGAFGYTYGNNAVMQMYRPGDAPGAYGVKVYWFDEINAPGAQQMIYLKQLLLSRPYFERVPDQSLIAGEEGTRYQRLLATRGKEYAFIYTYNGRNIPLQMGRIPGDSVKAAWYDPRNGNIKEIGVFSNEGIKEFDPPGEMKDGNDWVLIIDKV